MKVHFRSFKPLTPLITCTYGSHGNGGQEAPKVPKYSGVFGWFYSVRRTSFGFCCVPSSGRTAHLSVFGLQPQLVPADGPDVSGFRLDLHPFGSLHQQGAGGRLQPGKTQLCQWKPHINSDASQPVSGEPFPAACRDMRWIRTSRKVLPETARFRNNRSSELFTIYTPSELAPTGRLAKHHTPDAPVLLSR